MEARLKPGVRIRDDLFGGVCYIPHRDDFFAADHDVFQVLKRLPCEWAPVDLAWERTVSSLAKLGICEARTPTTLEAPYSGPSFLGKFMEIPSVEQPLVLNCFATAHCPLKCVYCHADDLMQQYRENEEDRDVENVAATASMINAVVAVITGGDPLTRPERSARLIEKLAGQQKALVLDTSGVGNIDELLPLIKRHGVHVRVSLDAISPENDKLRPRNPTYVKDSNASRTGATKTIERCIAEGVPVTVQSVISAPNENKSEWLDLRDWMASRGVRNWVIHVAVKGGSARRIENESRRHKRKRGILPSQEVYANLLDLIEKTRDQKIQMDIRCTDTSNTPNSVLLVSSKGDLYTEGYAHNGKLTLFSINEGRPDRLRSIFLYVDRFGHARRYFNWNPWFFAGQSLQDICYQVPLPKEPKREEISIVETEVKHYVAEPELLRSILENNGFVANATTLQRDEYYDTQERAMDKLDFVVRLRRESHRLQIGMKGPRFFTPEGEYSRIEIEIEAKSEESIRRELEVKDLDCTWFFEKRRTEFRSNIVKASIALDEVPEVGFFLEIEGTLNKVRDLTNLVSPALGDRETRNYKELFVAHQLSRGIPLEEIKGASFPLSVETPSSRQLPGPRSV
jgi:predicted adenylyl cyclase CyaB